MSSMSYMKDLRKEADELGYTIGRSAGGKHLKLTHPKVPTPIFAAGTPSDHRVLQNVISKMHRMLRQSQAGA